MQQQYDNNNSGALFTNDRKQSETHPDLTGSAEVDGKDYWVSRSCLFHSTRRKPTWFPTE